MEDRKALYEVTLILNEGSNVSEIEKIISEYAEVKKTTDLQVRQFAYPIGKLTSGHYFAIEFVSESDQIKVIDGELKPIKSIIRHLITKAIRKNPEPIRTGIYAKKTEEKKTEGKNTEYRIQNTEKKVVADTAPEVVPAPTVAPASPDVISAEAGIQPQAEVEIAKPEEKGKNREYRIENTERKKPTKPAKAEKLIAKKPRAKAEKLSSAELDKKLEELVKE